MSEYIETASDLNVEGVEFYVKDTPDGFVYNDAEFNNKVDTETLRHSFEMNDVVIIDHGIRCRGISMQLKDDTVVVSYSYPVMEDDNFTFEARKVESFDKLLITDVEIAAGEDLFGKVVSDLQENIEIVGSEIKGALKYVEGYTGFSSKVEEQSGNYLAIHNTTNNDEPIVVELIGGTSGPVQLDADGIIVIRIANKEQIVRVTSGNAIKEYTLRNIILVNE